MPPPLPDPTIAVAGAGPGAFHIGTPFGIATPVEIGRAGPRGAQCPAARTFVAGLVAFTTDGAVRLGEAGGRAATRA